MAFLDAESAFGFADEPTIVKRTALLRKDKVPISRYPRSYNPHLQLEDETFSITIRYAPLLHKTTNTRCESSRLIEIDYCDIETMGDRKISMLLDAAMGIYRDFLEEMGWIHDEKLFALPMLRNIAYVGGM